MPNREPKPIPMSFRISASGKAALERVRDDLQKRNIGTVSFGRAVEYLCKEYLEKLDKEGGES